MRELSENVCLTRDVWDLAWLYCPVCCHRLCRYILSPAPPAIPLSWALNLTLSAAPWCTIVLYVELNAQFEDMLKTNDDARKEAISHLNEQTSQRPMDTDWFWLAGFWCSFAWLYSDWLISEVRWIIRWSLVLVCVTDADWLRNVCTLHVSQLGKPYVKRVRYCHLIWSVILRFITHVDVDISRG